MEQKSLISLLVKNEKGVLARISELISEAGINIEKLVASSVDMENKVSKIIFYLTGDRKIVDEFFKKHIETLQEVISINNFMANDNFVEKELLMVKLFQNNVNFSEINNIISLHEGMIIYINEKIIVYQIISDSDKIDDIIRKIYFLTKDIEISRTGIVAMDFSDVIKSTNY